MVATSNVVPEELYKDGLNRALFLPFLTLLRARMDVFHLEARTDFRLEKLKATAVYHVPADQRARESLDRSFFDLTGSAQSCAVTLTVLGRALKIPVAAAGVARMSFAELCESPLGPADYLALARQFHTLILENIPILRPDQRDTARQFIILIDALYDQHVKLLASARAEPAALYVATQGDEARAFARTASRLIEMRSQDYLGLAHGRADSNAMRDISGIIET